MVFFKLSSTRLKMNVSMKKLFCEVGSHFLCCNRALPAVDVVQMESTALPPSEKTLDNGETNSQAHKS